jgi:ADP-heptose:LPS heptosyltransferase
MSTPTTTRIRVLKYLSRLVLRRPANPVDRSRIERVLVYGGMGIGNTIMLTPALRALREGLPGARITVLTGANGADQVVAGGPLVDEVIKIGPGALARFNLALRLRAQRFDVLISSFQGDDFKLVTLLSGIPYRVGHTTSGGWTGRADFLYNLPVRMEEDEHEVDRKLRLPLALGLRSRDDAPAFHIADADRAAGLAFLRSEGVRDTDLVIGLPVDVSPGQEWKQWSPERLAAVCNELEHRHGCRFILLGAPDHRDEVAAFTALLEFEPIVALGRASLRETAAILERCALTICADTGLMHVSAAVGTPALAIFGPTDYRRTSPVRYGTSHRIVRKPVECGPCFRMEGDAVVRACSHRKCLGLIQSDEIMQAAEEMLGLVGARPAASVG